MSMDDWNEDTWDAIYVADECGVDEFFINEARTDDSWGSSIAEVDGKDKAERVTTCLNFCRGLTTAELVECIANARERGVLPITSACAGYRDPTNRVITVNTRGFAKLLQPVSKHLHPQVTLIMLEAILASRGFDTDKPYSSSRGVCDGEWTFTQELPI